MKYILSYFLLIVSFTGLSQSKQYLYYFDKDLNPVEKIKAAFYGTGEYEDGLMKLMLYNNADKHLIMIEHFTDSTLQLSDGLFQSYYVNDSTELKGNYVKGKEDGLWLHWNQKGRIMDTTLYNNGEEISKTKLNYQSDGKLLWMEVRNTKNKTSGIFYFDEYGNVNDSLFYKTIDEDKVFTKTEIPPEFPGGDGAWTTYIAQMIKQNSSALINAGQSGTCRLRFIIDKEGKVSDISILSTPGPALAKVAMIAVAKIIWIPAMQNGRIVTAYKETLVTFKMPGD